LNTDNSKIADGVVTCSSKYLFSFFLGLSATIPSSWFTPPFQVLFRPITQASIMHMDSCNVGLGQRSTDTTPIHSQFDPIELLGSPMPFVDPFHQEWCKLEAPSRTTGLLMLTHHQAMLAAVRPACQEPCKESLMLSPQHIMQGAATASHPELADADTELHEAVSGSGSGRVTLTPALAIHIFNQGKTRTKRTAALLSAEFRVSAKAIRDIWTTRTWAHVTRPHWPMIRVNEQLE
jgi:hypothetical protein